MADHSISISDGVSVFGLAPSNKWGTLVWGEGNWGGDDNGLIKVVEKPISETQTVEDDLYKAVKKYLAETQSVSAAQTDTELTDGSGYNYVFPGPTTDAEEQVMTDWTQDSASTTWTSGTVGSTEWT